MKKKEKEIFHLFRTFCLIAITSDPPNLKQALPGLHTPTSINAELVVL